MKKLGFLVVLTMLLQLVGPFSSANADIVTPLTFGTTVQDEITTDNESDVYSFKLDKTSRVQLTLKSYVDGYVETSLLSSDEVTELSSEYLFSSPNSPDMLNKLFDFEPGVYYFKVNHSSGKGKYELTVKSTEYINNDIEGNNSAIDAQVIKTDGTKQLGVVTKNDEADFYKINLDKPSRLFYTFKSYIDDAVTAKVYTSDEVTQIDNKTLYASSTSPNLWNDYVDLEPGVYYFKVERESISKTGKYELTLKAAPYINNEQEPNSGVDEATLIQPNGLKYSGIISWNDNMDYYKFQVKKTSKIKFQLNRS